jgi:prophage regulatory protein
MSSLKINSDSVSQLPSTGYLRLFQILGNKNAKPPIPALVPMSRSSWYAGVKAGELPAGVKIGKRMIAWKVQDIIALIEKLGGE